MWRRNKIQSMRNALILIALSAGLSACVGRSESAIGTPQSPLVIVLSPAHAPAAASPLRAISERIFSDSGLVVEMRVAASPVDAIEQLGTRKADAGILSLDEFLLAHEEYAVAPGLQALRGQGETRFDGVILVAAKSAAKKVADLDGGKFGFVDPYSVSGFLLPAQYLQKEGVKVEPLFLGSHGKALDALLKGEVSAIATYGNQAAGRKDLRILARTGTVPNEPLVFRKGLRPGKREALAKALKDLTGSPEGKKALLSVADITGFGPVDDEAYRSTHDILEAAGKSVYDIVPDGAEVRRLNQPYIDVR
jgi:phosphonate transport system substrate-binding protein